MVSVLQMLPITEVHLMLPSMRSRRSYAGNVCIDLSILSCAQAPQKPSAPPVPVKARTQEEAAGKARQAYAAQQPKAPPVPVKARTQEEAAQKAQQAYAAKPKAEAKTGRNFFERLRPEKVCSVLTKVL